MAAPTFNAAKLAMRKQMRQVVENVEEHVLSAQTKEVTAHVLSAPWYQSASRLSCYISMPKGEIRTDAIIHDALQAGKAVFVPFCPVESKTEMKMLRLTDNATFAAMKPNRWGIREFDPEKTLGMEEAMDPKGGGLDLIIMPGLAFDIFAGRLGHGRGYYDRYVTHSEQLNPSKKPFLAAVSLSCQLLSPGNVIPMTVHDRKPDVLVTPAGEVEKLGYQGG